MKKIFTIFLLIFSIKIALSFFANGLLIYPDESCFFLKAQNLIENHKLSSCADISELQIGNPYPLFSILISPIFLFFDNFKALHGVYIINALLASLIIFPLFYIFNSKIKDKRKSLIYATLITFIPILTAYERMIMSETLFIFLGIFSFYYYQKSLDTKNSKTKILSIAISLLAVFTRPFGFILPLSYLINELFNSKKKKILGIFLIIAILLATFLTATLIPNATKEIIEKIASLKDPNNYILILKALKNQINSLSIETLLIPSLLFFTGIFNKKEKVFEKLRVFFITLILLNLLISAQHIYKYLLAGFELDISTRYLNLSIIFIVSYFFILVERTKETKINPIMFAIFIIPLFFLSFKEMNHALNITLSPWYKNLEGFIEAKTYFTTIFLPTTLFLFILTLFNKKRLLIYLISIIFITQSLIFFAWQVGYSKKEINHPEIQYFKNQKSDILMIKSYSSYINSNVKPIYFDYFRIKTLSSNKIKLIHFNDTNGQSPSENDSKWKLLSKDFKYIITPFKLSLEKTGITSSKDTIYLNINND